MRAVRIGAALLLTGGALFACAREDRQAPVAIVGGEEISAYELDIAEKRVLGGRLSGDPAVRRKILESLALNRAIAQKARREMDRDDLRLAEAESRAYAEQFVARWYLTRHSPVPPITGAEIQKYYGEHPESFGGGRDIRYEAILGMGSLSNAQRDTLLQRLRALPARADLRATQSALKKDGLSTELRKGSDADSGLDPRLREVLSALKAGQSQVQLVDGAPCLLRVTSVQSRSPRPLAEVQPQIVEALSALRIRQAIEALAPGALADARVEYLEVAR